MESRTLFSANPVGTPAVVNVSKLTGPQTTETVVVNPTNPLLVYAVASNDGMSVFTASSSDGGHTWTSKVQFNGSDGFPPAQNNPTAAYDQFGNLFIAYRRNDIGSTEVLYSYDNGATFHVLASLKGIQDLPTLATGDGSVWLSLQQNKLTGNPASVANSGAVVYGSKVTGLGRIAPLKRVANVTGVNSYIESLAVGPAGQVAVAYQFATEVGPTAVYTRNDPDGLGPQPFSPENSQVNTQVGTADVIPAATTSGITAGASLAYDLSSDQYTGRLYLAYVSAPSPTSAATAIYLRYSDNDGTTWSAPVQVNDDTSVNSHFMPQVACDPVTGSVAVTWYDGRNDNGIPGQGGTNNITNDDFQVYGAVGSPSGTGVNFSPNFVVQPANSNINDVLTPTGPDPNQFGLHNGLAFYNGQLIASWADDSNSTGDNGDGTLTEPDVYSAVVSVSTSPVIPATTLVGGFGPGTGPLHFTEAGGTRVTFQLNRGHGYLFTDASGNLDLRASGTTTASVLSIAATGGSRRVTLADVSITGSLGLLNAPSADLTGNLAVQGQVKRVLMGNLSNGVFAVSGVIGTMTIASLTDAGIVSGGSPGANGVFAGTGDADDTFQAGAINSVVVKGAITASFIGAGVNPVDGIFGNGNDIIIGGAASRIGTIRAGSADTASRFEAGSFGTVKLPETIDPLTDSRFLVN
jgi:hypothetical protein